ncbi:MAG: carbohydrate-binding protein [Dethiobacteria bacterium]
MHLDDRISLEPGNPRRGQKVSVEYQGLLMQSGADSVWMHCGFDGWKNAMDIPMNRSVHGAFACDAKIQGNREMNFCFKDSADNWDNNNGNDWTCKIS